MVPAPRKVLLILLQAPECISAVRKQDYALKRMLTSERDSAGIRASSVPGTYSAQVQHFAAILQACGPTTVSLSHNGTIYHRSHRLQMKHHSSCSVSPVHGQVDACGQTGGAGRCSSRHCCGSDVRCHQRRGAGGVDCHCWTLRRAIRCQTGREVQASSEHAQLLELSLRDRVRSNIEHGRQTRAVEITACCHARAMDLPEHSV